MSFSEIYDLKEKIGHGAFSNVHRCLHRVENRDYAAKIINTDKLSSKQKEKLEKEAGICRMLAHPSIVRLHFTAQEARCYYMVFDLIQGGELFDDIVARESYCEQDASRCIQQILEAVEYCHKKNIVHRDLKPENLLLESKKKKDVKLADFGLAIEVNNDKKAWFGFAGTPGYMSPELIKKEPYGKPVDVWACGVILYILLVGYPPFWSENQDAMFHQIKKGHYDFPSPEWDDVCVEAKSLIKTMLTVDPENRISTTEVLQNPWIANSLNVAASFHRQSTVDAMKKFNAHRKLKGAILTTIFATRGTRSLSSKLATAQTTPPEVMSSGKSRPSSSNVMAQLNNFNPLTAAEEEIIQLTKATLNCITNVDYEKYTQLCDHSLTAIEPESLGQIVEGLDFHKFYFDNGAARMRFQKTTMLKPVVHMLGADSAVICYNRLDQYQEGNACRSQMFSETRVWHKKDQKWQLVHYHRSAHGTCS